MIHKGLTFAKGAALEEPSRLFNSAWRAKPGAPSTSANATSSTRARSAPTLKLSGGVEGALATEVTGSKFPRLQAVKERTMPRRRTTDDRMIHV
jgi:hypothetical protein